MEEHGDVSIEGEDNDPMEDVDHFPQNTFEDDGTNTFIHDTFGTSVDVVVATAYETDQSLPGILPQYSYTSEFGSALLEVGIGRCPLLV